MTVILFFYFSYYTLFFSNDRAIVGGAICVCVGPEATSFLIGHFKLLLPFEFPPLQRSPFQRRPRVFYNRQLLANVGLCWSCSLQPLEKTFDRGAHKFFKKMPIVQVPSSFGFRPVVGVSSNMLASRGRVSPVRRRLFSDEDDAQELDNNRRMVERQLAQMQREQSQQWNFDFEKGKPLPGRFLWTLPDRPSHPLPPPAAIKRPIDNQIDDSPLYKQIKTDSHIYDSINNNHRSVNQTKITGKRNRKSFFISPPRAIFRNSRV